jgi:hypothetical protein
MNKFKFSTRVLLNLVLVVAVNIQHDLQHDLQLLYEI